MATASYEILELRFVIKPKTTEAYIFYQGHGDCPEPGTTGWRHKTFPSDMSVLDIIESDKGENDSFSWDFGAPD